MLKGAEIHYSATELECLAVVFAVKKNRQWLHGKHFKIITDHAALKHLMTIRDPAGKLARWSICMQAYDFEIIHRKGSNHANVDALSRPPLPVEINYAQGGVAEGEVPTYQGALVNRLAMDEDQVNNLDVMEDKPLLTYIEKGRFVAGASKKQIKRIERAAKHYKFTTTFLE